MTHSLTNKNKPTSLFGLGEMQAIVAGVMGHDLATKSLKGILRGQLEDSDSTLCRVLKQQKTGVSPAKLLSKIETLSSTALDILQRSIASLHNTYTPSDVFGEGWLPDPSILRAAGLVAPTGKVASGYCVVVLKNHNGFHVEVPLYCDFSAGAPNIDLSAQDCAEDAVHLAHRVMTNSYDEDSAWLSTACSLVAIKTGQRYLCIEQDGEAVTTVPIDPTSLRNDLRDGSLKGLAISGVNAP